MRVMSICYKHKEGGFNKRLYRLYESLASHGYPIYVIASERLPLKNKDVRQQIIRIPFTKQENGIFWLFFIILSMMKAFKLSLKFKITKIVTFAPFYTALCLLPVGLLRVQATTFIRADNMRHSDNLLRNLFFFYLDALGIVLSKKVFFVSSNLKQLYQARYKIPASKVMVIPNNVENKYRITDNEKKSVRKALGIKEDEFVISTMGPFTKGKNFSLLISVTKLLESNNIKLIIVGDEMAPTGERHRLKKLTRNLGVQHCVKFCGWQDMPLRYIASSDLFVLPSRHEGSPNALLEALSCGIPCLGSDIREIKEILQYEDLLFPLEEPQVLARKIGAAMNDPVFYDRIRLLSEERCDKFLFDWEARVINALIGN